MSRYARQILLPEVGPSGQARLASAHVLVVGVGVMHALAQQAIEPVFTEPVPVAFHQVGAQAIHGDLQDQPGRFCGPQRR